MQRTCRTREAYAQAARNIAVVAEDQQAVTDQRNASNDRNNQQFREALGNVQRYDNLYDAGTPVELPNTYRYYWVNEDGTYVGTDDANGNPNVGSTKDWRQMPRRSRFFEAACCRFRSRPPLRLLQPQRSSR